MADSKTAASWGWYQDAIKWFIAIAAGLLIFGSERSRDAAPAGIAWWSFALGAVLLVISAGTGLSAYLLLPGAARLLEREDLSQNEASELERGRKRLAALYKTCVGALLAGVLLFTFNGLMAARPDGRARPPISVTDVKGPAGTGGGPGVGGPDVGGPGTGGPGEDLSGPRPGERRLLSTPHFTIFGTGPTLNFGELGKELVEGAGSVGVAQARELIKGIGEGIDTVKKAVDLVSAIVDLIRKISPGATTAGTASPTQPCPGNQPVGTLLDLQVGFGFDSAHLDQTTLSALKPLADRLQGGTPVLIEGHTDAVGSTLYNLTLSQRRADAVRRYLEQSGVPSAGLHTFGYGKGYPWLPYLPKDPANRRVRVIECHVAGEDRCDRP